VYYPVNIDTIEFKKKDYFIRANTFANAKAGHVLKRAKKLERLSRLRNKVN
jgi:hypothetical protein